MLWNGYARRQVNAYVAHYDSTAADEAGLGKYKGLDGSAGLGDVKTLNHLAVDDKRLNDRGQWVGEVALMTLKGDVDNLGQIFQRGLNSPTFAKMAALSRQVNAFFAVHLPALCATEPAYRNVYTVFAGGDDFFLIGPWHSQIKLADRLQCDFARYVAGNKQVHFSAGLSMTKPGLPIRHLAGMGEAALAEAKGFSPASGEALAPPKNAVTCFNQTMFWPDLTMLLECEARLASLTQDLGLSTGYVYGLLNLVDMAERVSENPRDAIWHSYFAYRTRRMLERTRGLTDEQRRGRQRELAEEIGVQGIERHAGNYRVALFTHLYQQRS